MSDIARELLERSLSKIENGWCQGNYWYEDKFCSMGAVHSTFKEMVVEGKIEKSINFLNDPFATALYALGEVASPVDRDIIRWNDDPLRTKEEVIDAFKGAIKKVIEYV